DLKDAPVPELMTIIRKYDMENDIIWYIPYQYLIKMDDVQQVFGRSFPMPDPGDEKNLNVVLEKIKPNAIASDMGKLSESFVETAHKFNTMVFVDERDGTILEWEKIIAWGTDGIQTDKPAELLNFLKHKTGK